MHKQLTPSGGGSENQHEEKTRSEKNKVSNLT